MDNYVINAIIVDDDAIAGNLLERQLKMISGVGLIEKYASVCEALPNILVFQPDVVFLDIEMPERNGFELINELRNLSVETNIVVTSGYEKHAIQALRTNITDFLVKPIQTMELSSALNKVLARKLNNDFSPGKKTADGYSIETKRLRFFTRNGFILVDPANIVYVLADCNYSELYLSSGKKEIITLNIGNIEKLLPGNLFFRISRSILVNLKFLTKVDRKSNKCYLQCDNENFTFNIPLNRIKQLEKLLG